MATLDESTREALLYNNLILHEERPIEIIFDNNITEDFTVDINIPCRFKVLELPSEEETWGKSLKNLPTFTIKVVEEQRLKSGKSTQLCNHQDTG